MSIPLGTATGAQRFVEFACGGLWAMVLALGLWPLQPYRPAEAAIAQCYRALAEFIANTCHVEVGQQDQPVINTTTMSERAAVIDAIKHARGVLLTIRRSRQGPNPIAVRLMTLVGSADLMFGSAIALAETITIAARHPQYERLRPAITEAVQQLVSVADAVATSTRRRKSSTSLDH
jgi:hypothetical protein